MNTQTLSSGSSTGNAARLLTTIAFLLITFTVAAQRDPVDVMLVLDKSGSMSQQVPGLGMTKWRVLQESVQAFLESYRQWGEDTDRIGVTYFDHTRGDFPPGGMIPFNPPMSPLPLTGTGSIQADMAGRSPSGATCLGGGIMAGYHAFDGTHNHRDMIIFTDGLQNMEPTVSQAIGSDMVIDDYNLRPDATGFPAPPLDLKDPSLAFRAHTIGIGDNALNTLLQDIAGAPINTAYDGNAEFLNSMIVLNLELDRIFSQTFVETLDEFSPQLVDIRRISGGTTTGFEVNRSADKVMIRVVSDPGSIRGARIRIEKDGRDFSSLLSTDGLTYRTFFIDSAAIMQYNTDLAGTWNVSINSPGGEFQATCIVNDESLEVGARTTSNAYAPGDTVSLEAILGYSGQPITDASSMTVFVAKPGVDTNDLFAQAANISPSGDFPTEEEGDPGQLKYEALIAFDSNFVTALQPMLDSIPLSHSGDGSYNAEYADTEESGIYRFVFRMKGNNSLTGRWERFVMKSVVLDFGEPDPANTGFTIISDGKAKYFQLFPRNKFGHLLGPNRLGQIHLKVDGKAVPLTDKLNGYYEAQVPESSVFDPDPQVVVDIKGATFYNDKYSGVEGSDLTFWDKYKLWVIGAIILLVLVVLVLRKL